MDTMVEMNIGTKFKTKDFDGTAWLSTGMDEPSTADLKRLLKESKEDEEFSENPLSNPSKRNAILFAGADVIIDLAQAMEYLIEEYPKPTVCFVVEDVKSEIDGLSKMTEGDLESRLANALSLSLSNNDEKYIREELSSFFMTMLKALCVAVYATTKEIDLEPYILQRVSERS